MPDHTRCIFQMMRKSPMWVMFHDSVYLKSNLFHKITDLDTAQSNHIAKMQRMPGARFHTVILRRPPHALMLHHCLNPHPKKRFRTRGERHLCPRWTCCRPALSIDRRCAICMQQFIRRLLCVLLFIDYSTHSPAAPSLCIQS